MPRRDATKNDQGYGPGKLLVFFTLLRGSANASTVGEGNWITARDRDALVC